MRICIDLDGTICDLKEEGQTYGDVLPKPGAINRIQEFRKEGHYIIIFTARHSKTCNGNPGLILARQGLTTLEWLKKYDIPYDEIHFGKPFADIYIDDNALRFEKWDGLSSESIPLSAEKRMAKK